MPNGRSKRNGEAAQVLVARACRILRRGLLNSEKNCVIKVINKNAKITKATITGISK